MNQEKMGRLIAECRKKLHLTQAQVGEKLGVTDKTVSKWEQGINAPNISLLNSLSELLNISTNELLNGEKNNENESIKSVDIPKVVKYYVGIDKKKSKRNMAIITIILTLVFLTIISLLILHNNYDNCFVYKIETIDDGLKVDGVLALTSEQDILSINSIKNISRYDFDNEMVLAYEYTLVSKDTDIYMIGSIEDYLEENNIITLNNLLSSISFYISENSGYDLLLNNELINNNELAIKVKYVDINNQIKEILIPLKLNKIFSNDKLIYNKGEEY